MKHVSDSVSLLLRPTSTPNINMTQRLIGMMDAGEEFIIVPVYSTIEETHELSNHAAISFKSKGKKFLTSEHYIMHEKATLMGDFDTAEEILTASTPSKALGLGRQVKNYSEVVWRNHRWRVAVEAQVAKFKAHPKLLDQFPENAVFVETSYSDIWGCGLAAGDEMYRDPKQWKGLNIHGFAITEARYRLSLGI